MAFRRRGMNGMGAPAFRRWYADLCRRSNWQPPIWFLSNRISSAGGQAYAGQRRMPCFSSFNHQ
jgi:hypothetical protein